MSKPAALAHRGIPQSFLGRIATALSEVLIRVELASGCGEHERGLLQQFDPRAKLVGMAFLLATAMFTTALLVACFILFLSVALALSSRVSISQLVKIVSAILLFTGAVALPALFLVPGHPLVSLPVLGWCITLEGLRSAAFLLLRATCSATVAVGLIFTTPWMHILKAFRMVGTPVVLVAIVGMTHRYIVVLSQVALTLFEARKSRIVGALSRAQARRISVDVAGAVFTRAFELSSEIHLAMVSRGYRGEVYMLHDFAMRRRDWIFVGSAISAACVGVWAGR